MVLDGRLRVVNPFRAKRWTLAWQPPTRSFRAIVTRRALSVRGAVARGIGVRRQRQLGVGGDIADIAVVADEADPPVAPLEPHDVARLRIGAIFEDGDHLAAPEPGWSEPQAAHLGVEREEHADVRGADAKRMHGLIELHVV